MTVNIVMLARNRHALTNQALRTLYRNTPRDSFNLTIIDDKSTLPPLHDFPNCAYLRIENSKGITGQARNLGVYWADKYWGRGDWLYLTDNDVYFTPEWLNRLVDTITDDRCSPVLKLIGGWNHPFLQPDWTSSPWEDKANRVVASHDAVAGASQLMRWETWDKYGPLDAHAAGVGQSEDWAFCQKIVQDGGKVGSIYPRVVFNTGIRNSFGEFSPGWDLMEKELKEAKLIHKDLFWE